MPDISIVIPTYNRGELLSETVRLCHQMAGEVDLEFIVIDDGSADDTPARLKELAGEIPNFSHMSIDNGGPGRARNIGADMATADIVLFLGDDIQPRSSDFFQVHLDMHRRLGGTDVAVLGKVVWPDKAEADTNFVMAHIQGLGGEQFGYAHLKPYDWIDWRFFYTANISVKRQVVDSWAEDGFKDDFAAAGYEDIEFAYRMHLRPEGFRIYFAPLSIGNHYHQYNLEGFLNRQFTAGMLARTFIDLHPKVAPVIGVDILRSELAKPLGDGEDARIADYISVIEGIRSWARLLDASGNLGRDHWHGDMLKAVFLLSYAEGFIASASEPNANHGAAYRRALHEFHQNFQRAVYVEATGNAISNFAVPLNASIGGLKLKETGLWRWATGKPTLVRVYRKLRGI